MKKKLILLLILFLTTGCSANYDIEIYNNTIKEKLEYVDTNPSNWDNEAQYGLSYRVLVDSSIKFPYPAFYSTVVDENDTIKLDGVEYYNNNLISNSNELGQKLEYNNFNLDNFSDSSIIKKCYQYFSIIEDNDTIVLSTSAKNKCFDEYQPLDNITVNLKTNHKVVSSNADMVDGYHYTWNLMRSEKDDAAIQIVIKKDEYIFNYENEFLKKIVFGVCFTGIIVGVSVGTYRYFKKKQSQMNEI